MNRTFIAIFVFCLLVLATNQSSQCSFRNAYTRHLLKGEVEWLSSAQQISNHCGSEWRDHGMCCNVNSLKKFVQRQNENLDKLVAKAKMQTKSALANLKAYKEQFKSLTQVGTKRTSGVQPMTSMAMG